MTQVRPPRIETSGTLKETGGRVKRGARDYASVGAVVDRVSRDLRSRARDEAQAASSKGATSSGGNSTGGARSSLASASGIEVVGSQSKSAISFAPCPASSLTGEKSRICGSRPPEGAELGYREDRLQLTQPESTFDRWNRSNLRHFFTLV